MASDTHWAQTRETGSLLGMRFLLFVYRYGGRWLFRLCLLPVICFYMIFRPASYRASQDYLLKMCAAKSDFPTPRPWHSFYHLWHFADSLLDKLGVWMGRITRQDVVLHDGEIIDELLASGQGALILISHLGNFEICQALSETRPNLRLTVLHHTANAVKFNQVLSDYNRGSAVDLVQVSDLDMSIAMQLSEKISAGQFIAIAADRVAINNTQRCARLDFLGHPAPFPVGPFVLATALQAPVLTIHCIRQGGRYHIYFEYLWHGGAINRRNRQQQIDNLMQGYVQRLQHYCLQAPWQWYNFYPFWAPQLPPDSNSNRETSP